MSLRGIVDAPRREPFVRKSGAEMVGPLTLAADPASALQAATKQYVDTSISDQATVDASTYLKLTGGTLTGDLVLAGNPTANLKAAPKQYVDAAVAAVSTSRFVDSRRSLLIQSSGVTAAALNAVGPSVTEEGPSSGLEVDSGGCYFNRSNGGTGANAGFRTTLAFTRYQLAPLFVMKTRAYATADRRIWIGLFTSLPGGSDDPTGHFAAFRNSSVASDTNWKCCTKDGTTINVQDSGVACTASTDYLLEIDMKKSSSQIDFYIDGVSVASSTSNLPGAGQDLYVLARCITTTATFRAVSVDWLRVETL